MDKIQFIHDIPFSDANSNIYRNIYVIEQWLRRIAQTALFLCHGEKWLDGIPPEILSTLKQRRGSLKGRIILDCENNANILWLTTLDELVRLLTADDHWNAVKQLTGYPQNDFVEWIKILREIRNIVGHNRATTFQTLNICNGMLTYLNKGIKRFKDAAIFAGRCGALRDIETDGYELMNEAIVIFIKKNFFYEILSSEFVDHREFPFIDIPLLTNLFKPLENVILAITVDIKGDSYSVLWTNNLSESYKDEIMKKIEEVEYTLWGREEYINQDVKYLCDPRIWFYNEEAESKNDNIMNTSKEDKTDESDNIIQFPQS